LLAARMSTPDPKLLFSAGDTINVGLPVNLFLLIGGDRVGPPHAQAGGNAGSIAVFQDGDWKLVLGIGERLAANTMWYGGSYGTTYSIRKAPNGDVYFIYNFNTAGIARIKPGGAPQTIVTFPLRLDNNLTINSASQMDVNSNGTILFQSTSTSAGDNRIFLYQDGQPKQILVLSPTAATASTIENRIVQSMDSFGIDDSGRVIAQLRFRGMSFSTVCIYDGTQWKIAAIPNQTKIGSQTVTGVPNVVRAGGKRLIAELTVGGGVNVIAEWKDPSWSMLVNIDAVMPNGQVANSISALDVNAQGDQLFQFSNGVNTMVFRQNTKLMQVHNFFRPTPQGDYLIRTNAMDLRDDGTVYFLAVTQDDEVVLYWAQPLF